MSRSELCSPLRALWMRARRARDMRAASLFIVLSSGTLLVACAGSPKADAPTPTYEQLLDQARQAQRASHAEEAVDLWRA